MCSTDNSMGCRDLGAESGASTQVWAVIFDCDGVLVDSEPLHYQAYQEVLRPLGLGFDYSRYLEDYIGFDDRGAFIEVFRNAGKSLDEAMLIGLIEAKSRAMDGILSNGITTFPGVVQLVRNLASRGVPLAVASGALRREVEGFIRSLGLTEAFWAIVAADDVERSKPDPETYVVALERLTEKMAGAELNGGRCMAIEDTPAGIKSAKAAGLRVIGVTNSFSADDLKEADWIRTTLEGLDYEEMNRLAGR